jgi:hypothetical protein
MSVLSMMALVTCGGRNQTWDGDAEVDPACRNRSVDCTGIVGGGCRVEDDCDDGVCCLSNDCGGGMCTYLCAASPDCPLGMLCDGGFCFFACNADADCAPNQECHENRTVCQF